MWWRALVLAVLLVPLGTGVAAAHGGVAEEQATDIPVVGSIEPAVPGLSLTVIEGGARLRLDNATPTPVQIMDGPVVESGGSVAWSDPRLDAPVWRLPLLVGDAPANVHGTRVTPTTPSPAPWWALTLAVALGTFSLGGSAALSRAAGARRRPPEDLALAGVLLAVLTAHVVHVLGAALVLAEPPSVGAVFAAANIGVGAWLLGLAGVGLIAAGQQLGPACTAAAGGVLALLTAFDTTGFHRAVLVYGWSFDLDRATTAIAFGGGVGLVLAGWALLSADKSADKQVTAAAAS